MSVMRIKQAAHLFSENQLNKYIDTNMQT